jgi:hypothetical protein
MLRFAFRFVATRPTPRNRLKLQRRSLTADDRSGRFTGLSAGWNGGARCQYLRRTCSVSISATKVFGLQRDGYRGRGDNGTAVSGIAGDPDHSRARDHDWGVRGSDAAQAQWGCANDQSTCKRGTGQTKALTTRSPKRARFCDGEGHDPARAASVSTRRGIAAARAIAGRVS